MSCSRQHGSSHVHVVCGMPFRSDSKLPSIYVSSGNGPLHLAVIHRHISIVEYLVEDVNVDIKALNFSSRYITNSFEHVYRYTNTH
eukprot:468845-Amorphochlora_amoeboformis.AAC.2